eukprot:scaffold40528_cov61-Attheya_sp.AAC.1
MDTSCDARNMLLNYLAEPREIGLNRMKARGSRWTGERLVLFEECDNVKISTTSVRVTVRSRQYHALEPD